MRALHRFLIYAMLILGSITVELTTKLDPAQELAPGEAHLRMLGVAPAAQGRGAGRALLEGAAALARAAGKTRLTLGTLPEMTAARRLYDSFSTRIKALDLLKKYAVRNG